ncbi:MAG: NmrA family NAD(P)-binding protein [Flavobacteriaceae bacterium]|nr:NmrA family NAD(P)-binding protein [Flavobacteriaceae bacterium]
MKNEQFLIIGGTGKTGRKVVESLTQLGQSVRIGSRSAAIPFDWDQPTTWEAALEGIDKVYITFQPDLAVPGAFEAIETLVAIAKRKGVKKLVLLSGKGETEAERCEQVVINSGLDYTIVRASWFNQNFSESFFLEPIQQGTVALPMPEARVPYLDTGDIADVVVEALLHDEHNGEIYELTGPELLTFKDVIEIISEASGRDINYFPVSLEAYLDVMKQQDVPASYIWLIEYLFTHVLVNPTNSVVTNDVEKVLKRPAKSFRSYAKETAATGVWNAPKEMTH